MYTNYSIETNIYKNIARRSIEGQADKKIWRDYKAAAVFIIAAVFISIFIGKNFISPYKISDYIYSLTGVFYFVFIIITFIFLREVDIAVNSYVTRKYEFYNIIYSSLIEKYIYTEYNLKSLKWEIKTFKEGNKLKSSYLITFSIYASIGLCFCILESISEAVVGGTNIPDICISIAIISPVLFILFYLFCFAVPLKKRVAVWYNINNDESKIIDEISSILIKKNIIEKPVSLEIKKQFKNPYFLILILGSFTIVGYIFMDSNLAVQEKQYLNMIYPVEDKLLEILGY
ncbi:MAG: hypothetical protein SPF17_10030 [Candidatus Mucispirillum faecigallinarum]|nr:hypothetical protein [Candidatus Mucispirillum faecigallinarum]